MNADLSIWAVALMLVKLLTYLGVAVSIGGAFVFLLAKKELLRLKNTGTIESVPEHEIADAAFITRSKWLVIYFSHFTIITVFFRFFLEVGSFSETGLSGMFDRDIISMLWLTDLGEHLRYLTLGIFLLIISFFASNHRKIKISSNAFFSLIRLMYLFGVGIVGYSFTLVGHVSELSFGVKFCIALHVIGAFWWMGSLLPLKNLCRHTSPFFLHQCMATFSHWAIGLVCCLIIAGVIVATQLIATWEALFLTDYGNLFFVKLLLVNGMLILGLYHKVAAVPRLVDEKGAKKKLERSIGIEMLIGLVVLMVTTVLTSLAGPSH